MKIGILQRDFPSEKEIRAAALKTTASFYFQIMCHRKSEKLKVFPYADENRYRPDSRKYFTACFCYGHITSRKLRKYVEAGIWVQNNLRSQPSCADGRS